MILFFVLCFLTYDVNRIKACSDVESTWNSPSSIAKKSVITTLYNSPESLVIKESEKKKILYKIVDENKDCFTFGTVEDNQKSFDGWILYSRSLYALALLGDQSAKATLLKEFEERHYRLEIIDCYMYGNPYELCLIGIWNQVASYDKEERKKLIKAARKGDIIPKNKELAEFWKNYSFAFRF